MNCGRVVLIVAALSVGCCYAQDSNADGQKSATRFIKQSGWNVPGFEAFETMPPEKKWKAKIDEKIVEVSMWGPELIRKQQGSCNRASFPHFATIFQSTLRYTEVRAAAYRAFRYSFQNQSFLYDMDANPCAPDHHTGSIELIAFYDDDGDGCFETLEYKDTRIPAVEPWQPRLAKWIVDPATKAPYSCTHQLRSTARKRK